MSQLLGTGPEMWFELKLTKLKLSNEFENSKEMGPDRSLLDKSSMDSRTSTFHPDGMVPDGWF